MMHDLVVVINFCRANVSVYLVLIITFRICICGTMNPMPNSLVEYQR